MGVMTSSHLRKRGLFAYVISTQRLSEGPRAIHRSSRRGASGRAPDSARLKGTGPGEVSKKSIRTHSDWGNLNPKERQEVLQSIGKEYPSHYRDIIEQYFKRLAADDQETGK
jgi:hypothetical protein